MSTTFIPTCIICKQEFYSKVGLELHLDNGHSKQDLINILKTWGMTRN